jgi:pyrroloquinoline quinone (PQQ) biosynthesis protein C
MQASASPAASASRWSSAPYVSAITEADRLRLKLELVTPELAGATSRLVNDPRVAQLYVDYLVACHGILRATIPLMQTARGEALSREDEASRELAVYLENHIEEEAGEDEWLLEDLEVLGVDRSQVLTHVPSANVACLIGAQYYWALHAHPVSILGFLAALEREPPSREFIDDLIARTGHDAAAFRTLIAHAERDPDHRDELDELIDRLRLTSDEWLLVSISALNSVHALACVLDELVEAAGTDSVERTTRNGEVAVPRRNAAEHF